MRPMPACISIIRQLVPKFSWTQRNPGGCCFSYIALQLLPWSLYDHILDQTSASVVVTMPPSPPVVIILSWQKDHALTWPKLPTDLPLTRAPCAWAQSSITEKPWDADISIIVSMSQGQPAIWTGMTARVLSVMADAMVAGERLPLSISTSAKTGVAPEFTTEETEAMKLRGVTIISSPGPMPIPCKARSSASVPLDSAIAWLVPAHFANSRSKIRHSCPVQ